MTVFAALISSSLAQAIPVSGWVTDWDTRESLAKVREGVGQFQTIWLFAANASRLLDKNPNLNLWALPPQLRELEAEARKKGVRTGPVIHNSTENGFDAALARKLIKEPKLIAARLKADAVANHWRALNIDLESLPAEAANQYEAFLIELAKTFRGLDVALSVCLHAQDGAGEIIDIARFQNWGRLNAQPFDFVVMAYDHAWSTSEPGALAPRDWLAKVWKNAEKSFGERLILALPAYGYHWKKNGKNWQGKSDDPAVLEAKIKRETGWVRDEKSSVDDGALFWLKKNGAAEQAVAFDDDSSVLAKLDQLAKLAGGGPKRIAIWRLGGVKGALFDELKKRK